MQLRNLKLMQNVQYCPKSITFLLVVVLQQIPLEVFTKEVERMPSDLELPLKH